MAIQFKDYNGNIIAVPTHNHVISDTQKYENTAYASNTSAGFIRKEEVARINNLKQQADFIDDKMKQIVYIKQ